MRTFQNKTAVITGAGSGIGRALALAFAKEGAQLALNDWNEKGLQETLQLVQALGARAKSWAFDVADRARVFAFAEDVAREFGAADILINNAGIALRAENCDVITIEEMEKVIAVNQWGVVYGTKAFLPQLLSRPESALVNISSLFGIIGMAGNTAYCMSKFAVRGFTEALRMELHGDKNIAIHTVHPGGIKTNIVAHSLNPSAADRDFEIKAFERLARLTPDQAAQIILRGIKARRKRIIVGSDAWWLDVLARLLPIRYTGLIYRQWAKFKKIKKENA